MKKLLIPIFCLLLLVCSGCRKDYVVPPSDSARFIFTPNEGCKQSSVGQAAEYTRTVYLYLDDGYFYPVIIPRDMEYVTDYSKYVYAKDHTMSITVLSGVTPSNFAIASGVRNPVSVSKTLSVSGDAKSGPKEAVVHLVNDKAVLVRTYDNNTAYETVLQGFQKESYDVMSDSTLDYSSLVSSILETLPEYTGFEQSVEFVDGDSFYTYTYMDGDLTISRELRSFEDAISNAIKKLILVTGDNVVRSKYESTDIFYVEMREYTLAVKVYNFNTSLVFFGRGDEARANIVNYLKE